MDHPRLWTALQAHCAGSPGLLAGAIRAAEAECAVTIADPDDITLGELLAVLDAHVERPLVFFYDGRPVKHG